MKYYDEVTGKNPCPEITDQPIPSQTFQKEDIMQHKVYCEVKSVVFVGTKKADELSVSDLLSAIKNAEDQIKELSSLENKPKKVTTLIKDIQDNIKGLVKIVDSK